MPAFAGMTEFRTFYEFVKFENSGKLLKRGNHLTSLANKVGWVKRDVGTIYVGYAYINAP